MDTNWHRFCLPHLNPHYEHLIPHPQSHISIIFHLVRNADDTTSRTSARITGLLALLAFSLAEIIGTRMHDDGTAQHALLSDQLDEAVLDAALAIAVAVGCKVSEVADVADLIGWCTVGVNVSTLLIEWGCFCSRRVVSLYKIMLTRVSCRRG